MTPVRPVVLVVDDKRNMLRLLARVLRDDADVRTADRVTTAVAVLEREHIDIVLCDLMLPDGSGLDVLQAAARLRPRAPFILMTAYATVETAVAALKQGAFDYLTKPIDPEMARAAIHRALDSRGEAELASDELLPGVHARSRVMVELAGVLRELAQSDTPILLYGAPGSGRRRIARALHQLSSRRDRPFLELGEDVGPILDAEQGGTLFVPEVGRRSAELQAFLADLVEPCDNGSTDLRLIASSEPGLDRVAAADSLRADLWARLSMAGFAVPPLHVRRDDIPVLARRFLSEVASSHRAGFAPAVVDWLGAQEWPGNVAELRDVVRHAGIVAGERRVELTDLPASDTASEPVDWASLTWAQAQARGRSEVGRRYLQAVLQRFAGDVPAAAAQAGVERESFYRLLRRHGVEPETFRGAAPEDVDPTPTE